MQRKHRSGMTLCNSPVLNTHCRKYWHMFSLVPGILYQLSCGYFFIYEHDSSDELESESGEKLIVSVTCLWFLFLLLISQNCDLAEVSAGSSFWLELLTC